MTLIRSDRPWVTDSITQCRLQGFSATWIKNKYLSSGLSVIIINLNDHFEWTNEWVLRVWYMPKAGVEHRTDWLEHLDTISDTDSLLSHEIRWTSIRKRNFYIRETKTIHYHILFEFMYSQRTWDERIKQFLLRAIQSYKVLVLKPLWHVLGAPVIFF